MKEVETLTKDPYLLVVFDAETLSGVYSAKALFQSIENVLIDGTAVALTRFFGELKIHLPPWRVGARPDRYCTAKFGECMAGSLTLSRKLPAEHGPTLGEGPTTRREPACIGHLEAVSPTRQHP